MQLHKLCNGRLAPAPKITVVPTHGVADDPQLLAPQAPARQRAFIQPCLVHLVPATNAQEGEREEISLAHCCSLSLDGATLPTSSCIRSSLSTVPLPRATSVLPPERRGAPPTAQFFSSSRFLDHRRGLPGWSPRGGSRWTFGTPRRGSH